MLLVVLILLIYVADRSHFVKHCGATLAEIFLNKHVSISVIDIKLIEFYLDKYLDID